MRNSLSLITNATVTVDDMPALSLSPEGVRALPVIAGPRLAVTGRIGPKCSDCRDFERVVTRTGTVVCTNPVHRTASTDRPTPSRTAQSSRRAPQAVTAP